MNMLNSLRLIVALLLMACSVSVSAKKAVEAFVNAPRQIFPLLDRNTRLDMVDYFVSGSDKQSKNALDGGSSLTSLTDGDLTIRMTESSNVQVAILPAPADSLVAVITTVLTPTPDSKIAIYSSDWSQNLTSKCFSAPEVKDWLNDEGRKNRDEVEALVPFLLVSYSYNPELSQLTLTNNTHEFLSEDIYAIVEPYLHKTLIYNWNGKRFTLQK